MTCGKNCQYDNPSTGPYTLSQAPQDKYSNLSMSVSSLDQRLENEDNSSMNFSNENLYNKLEDIKYDSTSVKFSYTLMGEDLKGKEHSRFYKV